MKKVLLSLSVSSLIAVSCMDQPRETGRVVGTNEPTLAQKIDNFKAKVTNGQQSVAPLPGDVAGVPLPKAGPAPRAGLAAEVPTITPPSLNLTLGPGSCAHVEKSVTLPGTSISIGDILFCVDRTGSMFEEIDLLKVQIQAIATQLATLIDDPAFGLISHTDYPDVYTSCGYAAPYGIPGDVAYSLNQPIDPDVNLTRNAVAALTLGDGADAPESYARVLYETYSDPNIGWRPGSRHIVVAFGDNLPHDCDIGSCLSMALGSTGADPGRNGIAGDADDLPIAGSINGMVANNITLIFINSEGVGPSVQQDLWQCWAGQTAGGVSVQIFPDGSVPGGLDLTQLIFERVGVVAEQCRNLTLAPSAGFESWVQNLTPPFYSDLVLPATVGFGLDLCVPAGTVPGVYTFQICVTCDGENVVCEADTVTVPEPTVSGFFTGGGHLAGRRPASFTFGFNAGYHAPSTVPSGELEFVDHDQKKQVHSTSVDHFTIDGDCCTFDGGCRVDNVPGFSYVVTACDNGEPGTGVDTFVIRVFDSGGTMVSTASGTLAGGNIQKHDDPVTLRRTRGNIVN